MDFLKSGKNFSFLYGGKSLWDCEMSADVKKDGNVTEFSYALKDGLCVKNTVKEYPDFDAYEWVTWFENTGSEPSGVISELWDADIEIPFEHKEPTAVSAFIPDSDSDTKVIVPSGSTWVKDEFYCDIDKYNQSGFVNHIYPGQTKRYAASGGRSSENTAPFFNIFEKGRGVIGAIGWTGQWSCEISRAEDSVRIKTGIEDAEFRLHPGEKIRTSSFVIMSYEGDITESQNKWRRLAKKHFSLIGAEGRAEYAPLCAGLWGGMSTDGMLDRIKKIKDFGLPFEYIWVDAGWYGTADGDGTDEFVSRWYHYAGYWRVNRNVHPDEFKEVSRAVRDAGMKLLLWFEPERAVCDTPIVKEHPEYFLENPSETDKSLLLDLGNDSARKWCFDLLAGYIERLGISCYRQDFNYGPLEVWRYNDAPDRKRICEIKYINGLYRLWDGLLERFPQLIIDNCASGGRRIDIETLRRSVPLWRSDAQCPANHIPEVAQAHNVAFGTWMPYSGTGSGRIYGDVYRIRSAYACGMTTNYTFSEAENFGERAEDIEWIRKYCGEYLKVRPYFCGDMYPLADAEDGDGAWAAVQYNRPEEQDGMIQVFRRAKSPYTTANFTLRGLNADGTYMFTDADGGEFEISGRELIENGLNISIKEKRTAKIYFYKMI